MKNYVVESYENYREEERLSTNNARRIEFITTVRALDELIVGKKKILDCAAGTGVYAFYLADSGHEVTATDITPRHIEVIKEIVKDKTYEMDARVLDATDMSVFEDETFDVVLNMGPFYHLINEEDRKKCFWTDTYYSTDEEMENLYREYGMEVIDHFAQDGATPHFSKKVDEWNGEQFKVWCDYHYSICRQKPLLGASNHVVIVGRK